jgi:uncharacterized protein YoxC
MEGFMTVDLQATNWLLAVIAIASAVQMLAIIGAGIMGFRLYRQVTTTLNELETRHVAPLRQQVDGILADVHAVTARVSHQTERVDHAISDTIERVDETKERVKHSVREQVWRATGVVRGIRAVIASLFTSEPPVQAGGRI